MFPGGLASQGSGAVTPLAQIPSLAWKLMHAVAKQTNNNKTKYTEIMNPNGISGIAGILGRRVNPEPGTVG